jgi:beta-glucosidase
VTGVTDGASYPLGSVPAADCSTSDALSGVATEAAPSITGGNADGSGSFTATCSGATDLAGNTGSASVTYTVTAATFPTTAVLDSFNRANGKVGSSWEGLTGTSFYRLISKRLDVQLGGPLVWKPASFGADQEAFVTLSKLDSKSPSMGVLLKVQTGSTPNAGAISVVYDARAKAVRVSTLRLGQNGAWTPYANQPVTFANGDVLGAQARADGTVLIYKNDTLVATVTLNTADQSFFNAKGGKIGIWTAAARKALLDDFGGGTLP